MPEKAITPNQGGRAVALHECCLALLTESRRIALLNLGFMETRVNDYHFGTLRSVAGSDDLGSEIFCKIPVGNIVGRWNNGRRGTANDTPKTEWWDVKFGKAVRCTPPVRCTPYYRYRIF
jgi:hypothetical protein